MHVKELLCSSDVEEKIAGILLIVKAIEKRDDSKATYETRSLISLCSELVPIPFLLRMCSSKLSLMSSGGMKMLFSIANDSKLCPSLKPYFDAILLASIREQAESDNMQYFLSICERIISNFSSSEVSENIEKIVNIAYSLLQGGGDKRHLVRLVVKRANTWVLLNTLMQLCIVPYMNSGDSMTQVLLTDNCGSMLRGIFFSRLQSGGKILSKENDKFGGNYDDWLGLLYRYLKHGVNPSWLVSVKDDKPDEKFVLYVTSVFTTELHLTLEELSCLYIEERESLLSAGDNSIDRSKNHAFMVKREKRCVNILFLLLDFLDLFLDLLVVEDDVKVGFRCLSFETLLNIQKTILTVVKEAISFTNDVGKIWNQLDPNGDLVCKLHEKHTVIFNRIFISLCKWCRDDESIYRDLLHSVQNSMRFSKLYQHYVKNMTSQQGSRSSSKELNQQLYHVPDSSLNTILCNSITYEPSSSDHYVYSPYFFASQDGVDQYANVDAFVGIFDHMSDTSGLYQYYANQDILMTFTLFVADYIQIQKNSEEGDVKSRTMSIKKTLEELSMNLDHFMYVMILLVNHALVVGSSDQKDRNNHDEVVRGAEYIPYNVYHLLQLLHIAFLIYDKPISKLVDKGNSICVALNVLFHNDQNRFVDLYRYIDIFMMNLDKYRLFLSSAQNDAEVRADSDGEVDLYISNGVAQCEKMLHYCKSRFVM